MDLRLPNSPDTYSQDDQAQTRRLIEQFSRQPFANISEYGSTVRIQGGDSPLDIYTSGRYLTAQFAKGSLGLYPQDGAFEGGQINLLGALNSGGTPFQDWSLDNFSGFFRLFSGATAHFQVGYTGAYYVFQVFDQFELNGTSAALSWYEADQASNEKRWDMAVDGKTFFFRTVSDDYTTATNIFTVTRGAGQAVNGVRFSTVIDFLPDNTQDIGIGGNRPRYVDAGTGFKVAGTVVVGARVTGWGTPTGTLSRATFDQSTVTLPLLAQRVAALITDLKAVHGLIGT